MTEEIIIDGVNVAGCEHLYGDDSCDVLEFPSIYCAKNNCRYKEFKHLQRENKEKIDIIEQMIKILYPNANDDELYDVAFNGEYIDKLKELKDTADTMLMANDIKKQDIDSLREANERLEQENEKLKEDYRKATEISIEKVTVTAEAKRLQELEQENNSLQAQLNNITVQSNNAITALEQDIKQLTQWLDEARNDADFWCNKCTNLEQENKELKEWKERVVKLFESACRCKYLNEEKDICSYSNEKCININKCVYKYQELSDTYRSALDTIRRMVLSAWEQGKYLDGGLYNDLINEFTKINEVLQ